MQPVILPHLKRTVARWANSHGGILRLEYGFRGRINDHADHPMLDLMQQSDPSRSQSAR